MRCAYSNRSCDGRGKAYQNITLPVGDMNGDGSVNVTDLNILWNAENYNKGVDDCTVAY